MSAPSDSRPWLVQMDRANTERWLMESKVDGTFLIRESDSVKGAYVLSTM